jgi:hypothetical protein
VPQAIRLALGSVRQRDLASAVRAVARTVQLDAAQ